MNESYRILRSECIAKIIRIIMKNNDIVLRVTFLYYEFSVEFFVEEELECKSA